MFKLNYGKEILKTYWSVWDDSGMLQKVDLIFCGLNPSGITLTFKAKSGCLETMGAAWRQWQTKGHWEVRISSRIAQQINYIVFLYLPKHVFHHSFGTTTATRSTTLNPGRTVDTALNLMLRLREAGIRSHFWVWKCGGAKRVDWPRNTFGVQKNGWFQAWPRICQFMQYPICGFGVFNQFFFFGGGRRS